MSLKLINQSPTDYLASFDQFGIHLGLERIQQLLEALGNPHQQVPVIHIAGTNGKGSVCAFLLSILQAAGYRVGRYTSPHLVAWGERITINGEWISDRDLVVALSHVENAINPELPPTQFEVITAAMWWHFAHQKFNQKLDIAIIETGLGGRLDATNVCDRPLVCAITAIGLDHCQQLGDTLAAIAFEKAGIMKPQCPVVVAEPDPEAKAIFQIFAQDCNAPITWVSPAVADPEGAIANGFSYPLPLLGEHQLSNSAVAIAAIQALRNQGWQISDAAIREGMAKTQWAGRLQWVDFALPKANNSKNYKILIDGAHNVAAAVYLRKFVDQSFPNRRCRWLIGILNTKDAEGILKELLRPQDLLFAVPVPSAATIAPSQLAAIAAPMLDHAPQAYESLEAGLEAAFIDAQNEQQDQQDQEDSDNDLVILCGSLYLVGEFLGKFQNRSF